MPIHTTGTGTSTSPGRPCRCLARWRLRLGVASCCITMLQQSLSTHRYSHRLLVIVGRDLALEVTIHWWRTLGLPTDIRSIMKLQLHT